MFTVDRADIDSRLNIVGEILERRGFSNDASTYSNGNLSSKLVFTLLYRRFGTECRICRSVIQVDVRQNHVVVFVTSLRNLVTEEGYFRSD